MLTMTVYTYIQCVTGTHREHSRAEGEEQLFLDLTIK